MLFKSSIGIDINGNRVHAVRLKGSFKGVTVAAQSRLLLDESRSGPDREADITEFVNGFVREQNFSAAELFIGIAGDPLILRKIEFPLAVRENLRATLAYEIEKYVPFSADDGCFDYQVINEDKAADKLELLLAAVKKEALAPFLGIAENIGQGVSGIEIASVGAVNYCLYRYPDVREPMTVVVSRGTGADVLMVRDKTLIYAKTFADRDAALAALSAGGQLAGLREALWGNGTAGCLALCGDGDTDDLRKRLSSEFQTILPVEPVAALSDPTFIPAFGLALKGIRPVPVRMNLMPPALRKKPDRTGLYVMAALAVLVVLTGVLWAGSQVMAQRQALKALASESARLKAEAAVVERMTTETRAIRDRLTYLRALRPGNVYVIEIMNELSQIIPDSAYLTDFKITGGKLALYGLADSASELISILEESPLFKDAAFLSAIRNSREGKEVFRIGCNIEPN